LIEAQSTERHEQKVTKLPQHYLIVAHDSKGLELPHIFSDLGKEVLPVFSSETAAQEFLCLCSLQYGWYVRGFSGGELVSMLFAFHASINGVVLDPQPAALSEVVAVSVVGRNAFVGSLLESSKHHSAVGASP
jgi:hypothetical protein